MIVLEQLSSLFLLESWLIFSRVKGSHLSEFLQKMFFEAIQSRLLVFLLSFVLGHDLAKVVLDPNLVVVSHVALFQQVEGQLRLHKIEPVLVFFFLSQLVSRPLKLAHLVYVHFALFVDTDQELVVSARTSDELCEDEHRLIGQLFQSLSVVGLVSACLVCLNEHLFYAILRDHDGYRPIQIDTLT